MLFPNRLKGSLMHSGPSHNRIVKNKGSSLGLCPEEELFISTHVNLSSDRGTVTEVTGDGSFVTLLTKIWSA